MTDYDPEELPRTDGLELALLSEVDDAEDFRDLWGKVLDEEVFKKIDAKLTGGEADLDVNSLSAEHADIGEQTTRRLQTTESNTLPRYANESEMLEQTDTAGSIGVINGRLAWRREDTS